MKVLVAIAANIDFDSHNRAISCAGNQVQLEILSQAEIVFLRENVTSLVYAPSSSWPNGKLWVVGEKYRNIVSFSYLNIPLIKSIYYSFMLFIVSIKSDVDLIIKYNVTFSEALFLRLIKIYKKDIKIAVVIQDISSTGIGIKRIRDFLDYTAVLLTKKFDILIPVSEKIKTDFNFPDINTYIFRGGMTRQTRILLANPLKHRNNLKLKPYAVFAGALEKYNGIDLLVDYWLVNKPSIKLKIYGNGSLSSMIKEAERISCGNIFFGGHVDESVVTDAILESTINFCLRYSKGINQNYFFPSKFFNLLATPGLLICNKFNNFSDIPKDFYSLVDDDLANLKVLMDSAMRVDLLDICTRRRSWLKENCNWVKVVNFIYARSNK